MSDTPVDHAQKAMTESAQGMKAGMDQAASTAQDMGRQRMEKGMAVFLQAQRRNMEVLSAANRVALEGAQTVAKRHMEIMQQTVAEMTEAMREMASPDSPQVKAARQAEMLKVA